LVSSAADRVNPTVAFAYSNDSSSIKVWLIPISLAPSTNLLSTLFEIILRYSSLKVSNAAKAFAQLKSAFVPTPGDF